MYTSNSNKKEIIYFFKKILILLILCIVILYLLSLIYKKFDRYNGYGTQKFKEVPEQIEISNVGSSHGLYGFCYDEMTECTCFNFGLVSQSLDYDYRILQQYEDHLQEGGTMFIVVSYTSLYGPDESEQDDFVSKNRRYYRILSPRYIKEWSFKQQLLADTFAVMGTKDNVLHDLATGEERGKIITDMWEWNLQDTDEEAIRADAEATYKRHVKDRMNDDGEYVINPNNLDALYGIVELCKDKDIEPVLLTTPYMREYIEQYKENFPAFFEGFYSLMDEITEDTGTVYYDYSCDTRFWEEPEYFFSVDHLNKEGAMKFTKIVTVPYR